LGIFLGDHRSVFRVAFSPDGQRLATVGEEPTVKVWDLAACREFRILKSYTPAPQERAGLAFSPDGQRLVAAGRVWALASGQVLRGPKAGDAISPDGRWMASLSPLSPKDQTVTVWDPATGQELCTLKEPAGQIGSVTLSPNGQRLASTSTDRKVKI